MKKWAINFLIGIAAVSILAGCASQAETGGNPPDKQAADSGETAEDGFRADSRIAVVSREDGSGTRGAFIELFGVEQKDASGKKMDHTTDEAEITNSTSVMMTNVSGNPYAIGYISLGSLNDSVKAVRIDGTDATVENIKSNAYKIARPFHIAVKQEASDVAKDFIEFILSGDGQKIVEENGYISVSQNGSFTPKGLSGKIVVAGSSSVTPVMEKLKEGYLALNPDVSIEIQQSDSTTGIASVIDGVCDIGMASRDLKDSELQAGIMPSVVAMDGIAVIVNQKNPVENLTIQQVQDIYTGVSASWEEVLQ